METNDTDPQREQPVHDDASRTEPGPPPEPDPESDGAADAASLLAGLAESSQPTQDVAETEGHIAAAYAVPPHRPPRANDKTVENPAVFINATVPLPQPPSSAHVKLGPPAPPVVSMKGALTVPGGARLFEQQNETTEPGERTRNQTRVILASIAGVVVAALVAIAILIVTQRTAPKPASSSAPAVALSASAASAATPSILSSHTVDSAAVSTSPPTSAAPTVTAKPPRHDRHGSPPSARPSATFAEPDRQL